VQQHRNKLKRQSLEITEAVMRKRTARVLSVGCGGCLDWAPILPDLRSFDGEIVLNDHEPAALEFAEQLLRPVTTKYRLMPGNVIRSRSVSPRGIVSILYWQGTCSISCLIEPSYFLFVRFTRISWRLAGTAIHKHGEGNPWRILMEYGSDWNLVERSEDGILQICREAGIPRSSISLTREATRLTVITRVVR
jgi:hypothetical protein